MTRNAVRVATVLASLFILFVAPQALAQTQIYINEFYRAGNLGTTDEWVELVLQVPLTAVQLEGFFVGDSTSTTAAKFSGYKFTNMGSIAANFPAGTIIVVAGTTGPAADLTYNPAGGDWNITLKTSGANITSNGSTGDFAATDVAYVDTNGTNGNATLSAAGFAVNWHATPGAFGAAASVTITAPANNTGAVLTSGLNTATTAGNWSTGVALGSMTPGQPNGGANTTYINALRAGPVPTISIGDAFVFEGNAGTVNLAFTVSLTAASASNVDFTLTTSDIVGGATGGVDYVTQTNQPYQITAGNTSTIVNVVVNGDVAIEPDEDFNATIGNIVGATPGDTAAVGTIKNDDSPTLNIDDVAQFETEAGTTNFVFTVSLTQPAGPAGVTFDVNTANGPAPTATAGTDYVAITGGTGSIPFNTTSTTVTVTVNGDTDFEPSEKFFVNISNIAGATPGDVQGLGTIVTDDIGMSIDNVTQNELNSGTSVFTFTVSLTSPAEGAGVTFDIATQDGAVDPATAGSDYVAKTELGRTIAAGASSATFTVTVNGDVTIEPNETFFVNVTNPNPNTIVEITDGQGLGTITNDDLPAFAVSDAAISEGNGGTQLMTFTVTLTPAAGAPTSVDYSTADDSATAVSGDFVGIPVPITLPFAAGETSKQFTVTINGDMAAEGDEQFFVNLTNPTGGTAIADGQGFGIIRMDDPRSIPAVDTPVLENFDALASTNVPLGTPAATTPIGWTYRETGASANDLYLADDGGSTTGNTYSFGTDSSSDRAFGGLFSSNLTPTIGAFFKNDTGATITTLTISYFGEEWRFGATGRGPDRLDFQYSLDATSPTTGTWTDFDNLDFLTPDVAGPVGSKNGNAAQFRAPVSATITGLSIPNGAPFWIRYNDFNVTNSDDGLAVDDFSITANITGGITINDPSIVEGNSGTQILTFTVTRSDPAPVGGTTVNYTTANNTALDTDNDYVPTSGTATIPQGQTTTTIDVTINGDTNQEPTETFFVNLSAPVNGTLLDTQGVGTINADDFTLTLISAVQGSGNQSPIAGSTVTVAGIVTGIKQGGSGGFFVQEELADEDSNPNTSEGIFVFTAGVIPAGVVIGNRVAVTGTVQEFPASAAPHTMTELSGAVSVSVLATGQPLPAPFTLTSTQGAPSTNLSQYEPWEGMRVATTLEVTAPTGGNKDEPNATGSSDGVFYGVIQGVAKAFREPGIPVMDVVPSEAACPACIPRFDRNPERIRVSSTSQPGATQLNVAVGQIVSNLVGPLDYGFFEYSLLPEAASVPNVSGPSTYVAVPAPLASELTVSSINLERFYDNIDDPLVDDAVLTVTAFNNRLNKASLAIRNVLLTPDVVGVVEMENLTTLQALATKINADTNGATNYVAYLEEGNDQGGIDVGFLVNQNRVSVTAVTQFGKNDTFVDPSDSSVDILNDRPPLMLEGTIQRTDATTYAFTVIVNHLRSLNGNEENSGTGLRVREKRRLQAEFLANFIQNRQTANPNERIILVGDFNAFQFNDGLVDTIDTIKGTPPPSNEVVEPSTDLVNPNFTNLVDTIAAGDRYSYEFGGNLQVLDHAIVSAAMFATNTRAAFGHFDAGFPEIFRSDSTRPERVSDHDGIVAYFDLSPVGVLDFTAANYDVGEATTTFNVTVNRTGGDAGAVSATYTIAAGTATAGSDFTAGTGTISFADGETSKTFAVTIANDLIDEPNQTINLSLSNPTGDALIGIQGTATITILDDDAAPVFTINDNNSFAEGNAGSTNAQLTITLTGATEFETSVNWATAPDTATAGSDYTTSGGTVNFSPGAGPQTQTIDVPIIGDTTDEPNETLFVNLSSPSNATIGDSQGQITIIDDEGQPTLIISDLSPTEGDSGFVAYTVTVTLVGSTSQTVNVSWVLTAGTATHGAVDFSGPDGTMTFLPGTTTQTIGFNIWGDTIDETDETFTVDLFNAVNATISDNQGVVTILDNDPPPVFTINDVSVTEGDAGSANAQLIVTLNSGTVFPTSVTWATANDTATAGSDYTTSGGTLNFPPSNGPQSQTIDIPILGDTTDESNERLFVNLSAPSNATIGDSQGEITIIDNEGAPQFTISDVTVTEGDSGSANAQLTVTLTGSTALASSVTWATANDTAVAGSDYTTSGGTLNFPAGPGPQSQTIDIPILGDNVAEATERLFVNLSSPTNATLGDSQGQITINDNDAGAVFTISDVTVTEGDSGSANAQLTVTLTGGTASTSSVTWATANDTAVAGSDYTTSGGTLNFPAGAGPQSQTINIPILGDVVDEPNERLFVNLTAPSNAVIADSQGQITINDNDGAPTITINDISVPEGNSGTTQHSLTVTLNGATSQTVQVSWTLDPGTASCCGVDYSGANGTLSFPPGVTTLPIDVAVFGDNATEPDETVLVNLFNPVNATIADNQGVLTILNDDPDADGDGVSDVLDNCPATPNPTQTDTDNDGIGDACETDTDNDGVSDGIEQAGPNGGDGNGDGIADYQQPTVASIPAANGNGYLTLQSSCTLQQVSVTTEGAMPVSDASFSYPVELIAFRAPCSSATFSLFVYGSGAASVYRKFGPNPPGGPNQWYTLPGATFTTATVGTLHPRRVDFSLTDGGVGDDTPVDGVIVDQGGPATGNDIPTLSWEMLVAMAALLAAAAAWKMRG